MANKINTNRSRSNTGVISTSDRQITLFYNSRSQRGKQALAYAKTHGLAVQEIDILKTPITGTQITELADRLGMPIQEMVNQEHYKYRRKFTFQCFSSEDWITMIQNHPEIMKQPIALRGDRTILVETPTDIMRI
ncbi:arsenate reductase family protein [Flavobacteriaceae bacterium LMO-SS05]|jgi:arsenate reductase